MVKIVHLNGAFSEVFELEASPVEGQALSIKPKNDRKERRKKL